MQSFRELTLYQKAVDIVVNVYELIKSFPKEEKFDLISQIRRAAISIPANISEGAERQTTKEFIQFLYISKGSASELRTLFEVSNRIGYIAHKDYVEIDLQLLEVIKMLMGLISKLKNR